MKVFDQISRLLPNAQETLFLRASLHSGDSGREAWHQWQAEGGSARHWVASVNVLLPLLLWNLRRNGIDVRGSIGSYARAAHMTEAMRWEEYASISQSTLNALNQVGIPFIALKALALSESVYPSPILRHAADMDLWIHSTDEPRITTLLVERGWRQLPPPFRPSSYQFPAFVHPSGLPLELHYRLLVPYYTLPYDQLWARSEPATITGAPARVLAPPDCLLYVCAHAMLGGRILRWVPDAWFLLQRSPYIDWATVLSTALAARLALPLYAAVRYLADQLEAPIPAAVLQDLHAAAVRTDFRGRGAARLAVRSWPLGTAREIWGRQDSPGRRLATLWRRAFPPPREVAFRYDLRPWQLPFYYVHRFAWYAQRRYRDAKSRPSR